MGQLQSVVRTKELIIEQLEEEKKEAVKEARAPLQEEIRQKDSQILTLQDKLKSHATAATSDTEGSVDKVCVRVPKYIICSLISGQGGYGINEAVSPLLLF